jgi:hypothetical protein
MTAYELRISGSQSASLRCVIGAPSSPAGAGKRDGKEKHWRPQMREARAREREGGGGGEEAAEGLRCRV